jgi:hypothetical protein
MSSPARYRIKPGSGSIWATLTESGEFDFSDRDRPDARKAMDDLVEQTGEEGKSMATTTLLDKSVDLPIKLPAPAELVLTLPPAAAAAVNRVLEETGDNPGEMFRKALGLYMLALDARKRGKTVGSADSTDALETEFTGY